MPVATLDRIVRGVVTSPRRSALESLASSYGVSIGWLLTGEDASMPPRPSIGDASVEEAMRLWASVVFPLKLPSDLEAAMLDLPLAFEDFCGLLGLDDEDGETGEFLVRQRAEQLLGFREALRVAVQRHGAPAVREGLIARAVPIRLRLSHQVASLEQTERVAPERPKNAGRFSAFAPIFAKGGEFSIDWGSIGTQELVPLTSGPLPQGSAQLGSAPLAAAEAVRKPNREGDLPVVEAKSPARKASRGALKGRRGRGTR